MVLIDSCVLIDVLDQDPRWTPWSNARLRSIAGARTGLIDPVVLAELHGRNRAAGTLESMIDLFALTIAPLESVIAERAGRAFRQYRTRSEAPTAILADFLIGAHAVTLGACLLTRDRARFASYFPELTIIAPEDDAP